MQVEKTYQKDLIISEGGQHRFVGFGVLPSKKSYSFTFEARTAPKLVRVTNCHRDDVFRNPPKVFKYEFVPSQRIEASGDCLLSVSFISDSGRHQFGALTFINEGEDLPALLQCNGVISPVAGASACQAREGTIQAIDFSVRTDGQTLSPGCPQPRQRNKVNSMEWDIDIQSGYCLYAFRSNSGDFHKLVTFGYGETDID